MTGRTHKCACVHCEQHYVAGSRMPDCAAARNLICSAPPTQNRTESDDTHLASQLCDCGGEVRARNCGSTEICLAITNYMCRLLGCEKGRLASTTIKRLSVNRPHARLSKICNANRTDTNGTNVVCVERIAVLCVCSVGICFVLSLSCSNTLMVQHEAKGWMVTHVWYIGVDVVGVGAGYFSDDGGDDGGVGDVG